METPKDCFDATVWDVFCEDHGEDIDSLASCVTDYIHFCVDPTKTVLKDKQRVSKLGDSERMKPVQRELRRKIREGKSNYRRKMEEQLQQKDVSGVWRSLKTMSELNNSRPELTRDKEGVNDQSTLPLTNLLCRNFPRPEPQPLTRLPLLTPSLQPSGLSGNQICHLFFFSNSPR